MSFHSRRRILKSRAENRLRGDRLRNNLYPVIYFRMRNNHWQVVVLHVENYTREGTLLEQ